MSNYRPLTDNELFGLLQSGDKYAFEEIYERLMVWVKKLPKKGTGINHTDLSPSSKLTLSYI